MKQSNILNYFVNKHVMAAATAAATSAVDKTGKRKDPPVSPASSSSSSSNPQPIKRRAKEILLSSPSIEEVGQEQQEEPVDDFDERLHSHLWFLKRDRQTVVVTADDLTNSAQDHQQYQMEIGEDEEEDDDDLLQQKIPWHSRPLNEKQRQIADHPPHIPLAVRAGAGTGKTYTVVSRAIRLVERHNVDPARILMLTFTKKASAEMNGRIEQEFISTSSRLNNGARATIVLPTVKTFHSLAFRWIRSFWKECGLCCYPSLIVSTNEKKNFMKDVMSSHVLHKQLKRCNKFLQLDSNNCSWDNVVKALKDQHPSLYDEAKSLAAKIEEEESNKKKKKIETEEDSMVLPSKQTKKRPKNSTAETQDELLSLKEFHRQCYLQLQRKRGILKCDLEGQWDCKSTEQVNMYLKLVDNARLENHSPDEYLPKDSAIIRRYDEMQYKTGKIDFDKMLQLFVDLLKSHQQIWDEFYRLYDYVIVDEYQDNSEVQSEMLMSIVRDGRVTVVGDDDQCIYEFRGASPGNFDRFVSHFRNRMDNSDVTSSSSSSSLSSPTSAAVTELMLEANYRSSGNILKIGNALLDGSNTCRHKSLLPAKADGCLVELWGYHSPLDQAKRIAASIKKRHDQDGIPWHEMSCLFRNFRMGPQPVLHDKLQIELANRTIPFKIAGGTTFLESAKVKDVIAYLRLSLTGHPIRMDDESFMRVLNKPARRIGKKVKELIKAKRNIMQNEEEISDSSSSLAKRIPVSLEEAAVTLCNEDKVLTKQQKSAIEGFFEQLFRIRKAAITMKLSELILFVWKDTGLKDWYEKQDGARQGKMKALRAVADSHVNDVLSKRSNRCEISKDSSSVVAFPSLQELARKSIFERAEKLRPDDLPQFNFPPHFIEHLESPDGRGLSVLDSFLADLELQMSPDSMTEDDGDSPNKDDRVVISTIHRSKGLEWNDVYVPYFNDKYMPNDYRDPSHDGSKPVRHLPDCASRTGGSQCDKECLQFYAEEDKRKHRNLSPEERKSDEERRLAHVAATRAKDRLVFISTSKEKKSPYEAAILQTGCVDITKMRSPPRAFPLVESGNVV